MKIRSVLIAGGAGFIGSNLARNLSDKYEHIIILDNLCRGKESFIEDISNLKFINHDISHEEETIKLVHELQEIFFIDEVWHMAANSDIPAGVEDPNIDFRDTFLTTFSLTKAFKKNPPTKLHFASSSAVYGDMGKIKISESNAPLFPISNYGSMKLSSEAILSSWVEDIETQLLVYRFPNVVGIPSTHGVILDFINKLKENPKVLHVLGDGNQQKPYLFCDDLISAMLFIRENSKSKRDTFNIGPKDHGTKVSEIAKLVCEISGNRDVEIIFGKNVGGWTGDVPKFYYDTSKLEKLGWENNNNSKSAVELAINLILKSIKENKSS